MQARTPAIALLLLVACLACMAGCGGASTAPATTVDLAHWTFEGPGGERTPVTLPAHLDGKLPKAPARYSLRTHVVLPEALRARALVLAIPRFLGRTSLLVDGRAVPSLDGEEQAEAGGYRARGPHAWSIPVHATETGALDLELEVDHRWTQSAWLDTTPRLTDDPDGGRAFVLVRTVNAVTSYAALSCALFAGYLYLLVFIADRRQANFGWFAVTGLTGFAYPLFETGLAQNVLGPFEVPFTAIGVTSAVVAQLHFTAAHFKLAPPSRGWDALLVLVCVSSVASTGYFTATRVAATLAVLSIVPTCFVQGRQFWRLSRTRPLPLNLFTLFGGWLVMPLLGAADFLGWTGFGEILGGVRTTSLDIFLIALLQTAALSRDHVLSLRKAEGLNDELRRQVAARSRELADALAGLSGSIPEKAFEPGAIVDHRYEIVRLLGAGAAGNVYLAERRSDRVKLAMKIVRAGSDPHALARLAREAQLAAEVKHENVIAMVDVDVATAGFLYVVMEYVAGDSLRGHAARYGDVRWALGIVRQIAAGLAAVHARGIIHRDLKPANVLLVEREGGASLAKIADFGIAGLVAAKTAQTTRPPPSPDSVDSKPATERLRLTQTGVLLGTPLYMAPETIDGAREATPAVDLFSFGVMAFELLTGKMPFSDSPALAQLQGVTVAPAPPLATICAALDARVAGAIDRCLSFDPRERPPAAEVLAALTAAGLESGA